jgi:predicted glycoside hydrolase/deacetylase ChbG (UPF0249 family)
VRRLIINADDFGLTRGVNRAIAEAHHSGVVTSATLMACSNAFDDAVQLAQRARSLAVGCHVLLVDARPLTACRSLLANGGIALRTGIADFARQVLRGKIKGDEVSAEAVAQIRKIQDAGIELSHFDTHKHTHMFSQVLRPLLRAARECGVRAVRNPFTPVKALAWAHLVRRPKLWVRYSEVKVLRRFAEQFHREVRNAGLKTTDGTFGIVVTGALDPQLFAAIIGCIPEGNWEFVCHPGYRDADLDHVATRLRASRQAELAVLTSPESKRLIERHGIELITYRDL